MKIEVLKMANYLMNPDMVVKMTPTTRVHNAYQALELGVKSGDPETDAYLRDGLQQAFQQDNVRIHTHLNRSRDSMNKLNNVLVKAGASAAQKLQPEMLSKEQTDMIRRDISKESNKSNNFHKKVFSNYVRRYGVPADDLVLNKREAHVNDEQMSFNFDEGLPSIAGVAADLATDTFNSVAGAVIDPLDEESEVSNMIDAIKGQISDMYSVEGGQQGNHSAYTVNDDYGFDERDTELER